MLTGTPREPDLDPTSCRRRSTASTRHRSRSWRSRSASSQDLRANGVVQEPSEHVAWSACWSGSSSSWNSCGRVLLTGSFPSLSRAATLTFFGDQTAVSPVFVGLAWIVAVLLITCHRWVPPTASVGTPRSWRRVRGRRRGHHGGRFGDPLGADLGDRIRRGHGLGDGPPGCRVPEGRLGPSRRPFSSRGCCHDPIDKTLTFFLVFLLLRALSRRFVARFPTGEIADGWVGGIALRPERATTGRRSAWSRAHAIAVPRLNPLTKAVVASVALSWGPLSFGRIRRSSADPGSVDASAQRSRACSLGCPALDPALPCRSRSPSCWSACSTRAGTTVLFALGSICGHARRRRLRRPDASLDSSRSRPQSGCSAHNRILGRSSSTLSDVASPRVSRSWRWRPRSRPCDGRPSGVIAAAQRSPRPGHGRYPPRPIARHLPAHRPRPPLLAHRGRGAEPRARDSGLQPAGGARTCCGHARLTRPGSALSAGCSSCPRSSPSWPSACLAFSCCRLRRTMLEVRECLLSLRGVRQPALRDVDLTLGDGEIVAIVGPNEAGSRRSAWLDRGWRRHRSVVARRGGVDRRRRHDRPPHARARTLSSRFQNPATQLSGVDATVFEEVALGPMNLGLPLLRRLPGASRRLATLASTTSPT